MQWLAGGEDLVYENGESGSDADYYVDPRTVISLIRRMAIRLEQGSEVGEVERYEITPIGHRLLGLTRAEQTP